MPGRRALVLATYDYADEGLRRLTAPAHDAEAFASVLADPEIAGFEVTTLVNEPHHAVGEAVADFYASCRRDDLALLYFSGHGLKDDNGRLYLAMTNTRRDRLLFTGLSATQLSEAMDGCRSRRKVLILDCCYGGAFPAGRTAKADEGVHTLEKFQGRGRAVLTATDATQYAFEGDQLSGSGTASVFTRHLVEAMRTGAADLDEDGDIALDELYSYVRERVVAEMPQQRPKKQEDVDGRIVLARNVNWTLPVHLRHAIDSPLPAQRLGAIEGLAHLLRVGNEVVRATVEGHVRALTADDSRSVSAAATALLERIGGVPALPVPVAPPAPVDPPELPAPRAAPQPVATPAAAPEPGAAPVAAPAVASVAPQPAPPAEPRVPGPPPPRETGPAPTVPADAEAPSAVPLLGLLLVGSVAQLLSRFLEYAAESDTVASGSGLPTLPWLLAVAVPLAGAVTLLLARPDRPWAVGVSAGLVAGAGLAQLDQALATAGYWASPDASGSPGAGWWSGTIGAVALLACAVLALRSPGLRPRPGLRRHWRAVAAAVLVLGALAIRLDAFADAWPWFAKNEPAILLAVACLPLTLLQLTWAQRLFGLLAVSILGPWVTAAHLYAFAYDNHPVTESASVLGVVTAVVSVAACYLAQAWAGAPDAAEPGRAAAARRS